MAAQLSDVEFDRMQMQLLELRENNYQLDEQCKRQDRELTHLRDQLSVLEKDNNKLNQTINKSKKAREFEIILNENESLQRKIQSQEEEFRLQSGTLMQELGQLVAANESLEKENNLLKNSDTAKKNDDVANHALQDEIRRLQAQNAALQNTLTTCQQEYNVQCNQLRSTISDLYEKGEKSDLDATDGCTMETSINENSFQETNSESDNNDSNKQNLVNKSLTYISVAEDSLKQLTDLKLSLDTEREENRLLKDQLQSMEHERRNETESLHTEIDRLKEKLKKKQESLLQLQEAKDQLFQELSQKISDAETSRDNELVHLKLNSTKLQHDLANASKAFEDQSSQSQQQVNELESLVADLESKLSSIGEENLRHLAERLAIYERRIEHYEQTIQEKSNKIDDLSMQLKESHAAHANTLEQSLALQVDRDKQIQALQEATKSAEKRKSLLDQLAVKYQEDADQHREQIKSTSAQYNQQIQELNENIEQLKVKVLELQGVQSQLEQLKPQLQNLEGAKSWLERRLTETEESLQQTKENYELLLEKSREDKESAIKELTEENTKQTELLQNEISEKVKENETLQEAISKLEQDIKDHIDDKKLHEKKGSTVLKDLKRQLQTERKRADKLQEKLQEFLSDSRSRQSVEELFRPGDFSERQKMGDNSSLSSWSPSGLSRDNILAQSPEEDASDINLRQENDELMKRLGDLQQKMWTLEEKVSHLESSNAAMADDLLNKSAVIEHYSMDSRAGQPVTSPSHDKITLKRVVDFVIDKGDENMKDINRKLQRVLEETLTKNMHLQQDLETVSTELSKLQKQHSGLSSGSSSAI